MGKPYFGRPTTHPTPLVAHDLHDDDVEGVHDGLLAKGAVEPEPTLDRSIGCR